jgi:hypothetical protein
LTSSKGLLRPSCAHPLGGPRVPRLLDIASARCLGCLLRGTTCSRPPGLACVPQLHALVLVRLLGAPPTGGTRSFSESNATVATTTCPDYLHSHTRIMRPSTASPADIPLRLLSADILGVAPSPLAPDKTRQHTLPATQTSTAATTTCPDYLLSTLAYPNNAPVHGLTDVLYGCSQRIYWVWHPRPSLSTRHGNTRCSRLNPPQRQPRHAQTTFTRIPKRCAHLRPCRWTSMPTVNGYRMVPWPSHPEQIHNTTTLATQTPSRPPNYVHACPVDAS